MAYPHPGRGPDAGMPTREMPAASGAAPVRPISSGCALPSPISRAPPSLHRRPAPIPRTIPTAVGCTQHSTPRVHIPRPSARMRTAPRPTNNVLSPLASRTPKPILQRHASPGRTRLRGPRQSAGRASCSTDGPSARRQPTSRRRRREVPHVSTRTRHRGAKNELSRTPSVARAADRSLQCGGFLR